MQRRYWKQLWKIRLVGGIKNTALQKKLLSTKNLTFKDACNVAKSVEAAEAKAKAIGNAHASKTTITSVHTVAKYKQKRDKPSTVSPLDQSNSRVTVVADKIIFPPLANLLMFVREERPYCTSVPLPSKATASSQEATTILGIDAAPDVEEEELYLFAQSCKKLKLFVDRPRACAKSSA